VKKDNFITKISLRDISHEELLKISKKRSLSLNLREMLAIQKYYINKGRDPTDIEIETIAQTWSEHCKHKVFNSKVKLKLQKKTIIYENLFKETIHKATELVRKQKGKKDFCISVFKDNAGIIRFNEKYGIAFKVETHNHPSALDPYGGANTGIGGVIRDILGCGLGAKPIFNTDIFCFGPLDYPSSKLPKGVMHPLRILKGVVAGVRDYGNRMGIPTINGSIFFHERYVGNPLVYCGTAGIIPLDHINKKTPKGYDIVVAGGRTGRDGIHGATFSSAELTSDSETVSSQAVQIGNPIEEKKLEDILLKARDLKLYVNITDCGAGGFASAIGEMCKGTGAVVWLDRAPLKYPGLKPWEIFLSESQERMVFITSPSNTKKLIELFKSEDVEATVIGKTTDDKKLKLYYKDILAGELDMDFLHKGTPPRDCTVTWKEKYKKEKELKIEFDHEDIIKRLLSHPISASKERIIRQYDHEVGGGTFLKPLLGIKQDSPSDASAVAPILENPESVVFVGNGINPLYGIEDPYRMALSAIDESLRQITSAGGPPHRTAILDNFCFGNPEDPEQMASFVMAAKGCYDIAVSYSLPFISGKDSFYNEFKTKDSRKISIPPTLLISSIAVGRREDITVSTFQNSERPIIITGLTKKEFGGSMLYHILNHKGGDVPSVDFKNALKIFNSIHKAIQNKFIESCHDLSENGLVGAVAEACFEHELGCEIFLKKIPRTKDCIKDWHILYSESNTRFIITPKKDKTERLIYFFKKNRIPFEIIGKTNSSGFLKIYGLNSKEILNISISLLKKLWRSSI